jgi:hypothetical protein
MQQAREVAGGSRGPAAKVDVEASMISKNRSVCWTGGDAGKRFALANVAAGTSRTRRWLAAGVFALVLATPSSLPAQNASGRGSVTGAAKSAPVVKSAPRRDAGAPTVNAAKKIPEVSLRRLPLSFQPNRGQADPGVKFLARGRDYSLLLMPDGAVLRLRQSANIDTKSTRNAGHPAAKTSELRIQFAGGSGGSGIAGVDQLPGKVNYFIGNDPKNWKTDVPTFSGVRYDGVYPGIDVVYHGNQQQLEYDVVVSPGADASAIRLRIDGSKEAKIDKNGDLILQTSAGELRFRRPRLYQDAPGVSEDYSASASDGVAGRRDVDGRFVMLAENEIGFSVGSYDRSRKLVIDPILVYSTLIGGSQHDEARGIAVDASGNAYITGWTDSTDFPIVSGAAYSTYAGGTSDIFISKLNAAGTSLVYSTYIGGSGADIADAIAVDTSGNAYITGETTSPNFPTVAPYQGACSATCASNSLADAFVLELNSSGSALLYSTYFGGNGIDRGFAIALDSSANVYVYGQTIPDGQTENFPTTAGAYQTTYGGGNSDAFVAKFTPSTGDAGSLIYSTYLGGAGDEDYNGSTGSDRKGGITIDGSGDAFVVGFTTGSFPTTASAYKTAFQGGGATTDSDAFVTEINPTGTALVYSTYLGGSGDDLAYAVALDSSGDAYVTGSTSSTNYPTTSNAYQTTCPATCTSTFNGFVTELNPAGTGLLYSTYLSGASNGTAIQNGGLSIALDSSFDAYITGGTSSTTFPSDNPVQVLNAGGNDAFVTELNPTGTGILFSTYLGGNADDFGEGIALDSTANIYVTGYTESTTGTTPNFPTTQGAFETGCGDLGTCNGQADAFIAKFNTTEFTLTTTESGNGGGTITSNPAGINCPTAGCAASFTTSTVVTLTATPNPGSTFMGWSGACTGTGTCTVTMNSDQSVNAQFSVIYTLTVGESGVGTGVVVDNTSAISCQPTCSASYDGGTTVTLTATASANSAFAGWSGAGCSGTGPCVVTLNSNEIVTANFALTAASACTGTTTNWIGPATGGNWSNAANWSTDAVPNSATTNVCISDAHGAAAVTLDTSVSVDNLYIDSGSSLTISNNEMLTVSGSISNAGTITVSANGNATYLTVAGAVTLTGSGTVTLTTGSNGNTAYIYPSGTSSLTNVNNTIQGEGQLPIGTLVNQAAGTINGNLAGVLLVNATHVTNQGLIEATGTGTLQTNGPVNNQNGTITANAGTVAFLNNTTISGGTLNAVSSGTIGTAQNNNATLDGSSQGPLTNAGVYVGANNTATNVEGTIVNTGTFAITANGNATFWTVLGQATLTGGGTISLATGSNGNTAYVYQNGTSTLTNVNNTIQGVGQISPSTFVNQAAGTVNANLTTGGGILLLNSSAVTNQGLLEATLGGVFETNSIVNNLNGKITATGTNSTVEFLNSAVIEGGTLSTGLGGTMETAQNQSATLDGVTQGPLTNASPYLGPNNSATYIKGIINNTGSFTIAANGNATALTVVGSATLTGGGTVVLETLANGNTAYINQSTTSTLTNLNNVIEGEGQTSVNLLVNQGGGTIDANASGVLLVNPTSMVNEGLMEATAGGTLQTNTVINNVGGNIISTASTVTFLNGAVIEGGTLVTSSGGIMGTAQNQSATLDGNSHGPLNNAASYSGPNNSDTYIEGTINNTGSFTIAANGNATALTLASAAVTLTGGGTVTLTTGSSGNVAYINQNIAATLTNVNNLIQGEGQIPVTLLINESTINANESGTLAVNATNVVNENLMEATAGGTLQFNTTVNNAGGTILSAASTVVFDNGTVIQGGTLNATSGGAMGTAQNQSATLDGISQGALNNEAAYVGPNNSDTYISGTINNTGSITIAANGNGTVLTINGATTLTGGGTVTLSTGSSGNTAYINQSEGYTLTNTNNLIQGQGQIGVTELLNQPAGVINANASAGQLLMDSTTIVNQGLIEATSGGTLVVNTTVNNAGGSIVSNSSTVTFENGARIEGGILNTLGTGTMGTALNESATLDGTTQGTLNIQGTYTGPNNSDTYVLGTINNTGAIAVTANGNGTYLTINGNTTLTGGGTVTLSTGANGNTAYLNQSEGLTLTNAGNSIHITGQLTVTSVVQNSGFIQIAAGSSASVTTMAVNGGNVQMDGSYSGSTITTSGTGMFSGTGTIPVPVSDGGVIEGGDFPNAGVLTISNSQALTETSTGGIGVVIGGLTAGTQYSQVAVSGTASLSGSINVRLINGFVPVSGDSFQILTASAISTPSLTINSAALPSGLVWNYSNQGPVLLLEVTSEPSSSQPLSVALQGTGAGGVADDLGGISCNQANGDTSGTCTGNYPTGTTVVLTETPASGSIFNGWGGACASAGTAMSCSVAMTGAESVTANFVEAPQSVTVTFSPGTNVSQTATFDCPSNANPSPGNPCLDPNAHVLQLSVPSVTTAFSVTVTAVQVPAGQQTDGLCEVGNSVANDFDCRFVTFFSDGTDANGNTIVPLCYPYANGNCVHYEVYAGTPGNEPNPSYYSGPVNWSIAWNNDSFVPPSTYATVPQVYDDPDSPPTPNSAYGTICGEPMLIGTTPQSYSCQFEYNITIPGSYNTTAPVDAGIGGTTRQFNDVVVAFPPNATAQLSVASAPDSSNVAVGSPIGFTVTVSDPGTASETNVSVYDPLPSGTGVSWSLSPAVSGCSISESASSQVLNCTFASVGAGTSIPIHVVSATAPAGSYVSVATITVNNQQFLTIATVTVGGAVTPTFSNLTASQSIAYGAASIPVGGTIAAGTNYPPTSESVSITINGVTQMAAIGTNGVFATTFATATIPASGTAYPITYSYAGDNNFSNATNSSTSLTVNPANQTITFTGTPASAVYNTTFSVSASSSSGLAVTIGASPSSVCTIASNLVTMTSGTGTCVLAASQSGSPNYNPATNVVNDVTAQPANQTITLNGVPSTATDNSMFTVSASSTSGLGVSVGVSGVCSISGNTVTITSGTGTCVVTATQTGNSDYNAATPVVDDVTAETSNQTITLNGAPAMAAYNTTFTISASASSGLPVTVTATGSCSISGTTVKMISGTGTCVLTATQAGNGSYSPATLVVDVTAELASQTITVTGVPLTAVYNTTFGVNASSSSGLTVSVGVSGVCTLSGTTVKMTSGTGTCVVTALQAGNGNYSPATSVVDNVAAQLASQTITLSGAPASAAVNTTFAISASASSGLTVTVAASSDCTISGNNVTTGAMAGTCTLTAAQAGNTNYGAAPTVVDTVNVTSTTKTMSTTTITGNTPNPSTTGQAVTISFKVTGSGGTPTGSVTVTASTKETCSGTLASGAGSCQITFTTAGSRTLTAVYSGDSTFAGSTSGSVTQNVNSTTGSTLSISPSPVNFGNVYVGTTEFQIVTLTNSGSSTITVTNFALDGVAGADSNDFYGISFCGNRLSAKASCTILLAFSADYNVTKPHTATLVVTDNAAGSPQSDTVTATVINPVLRLSANNLNFGRQKKGTTGSAQTVMVSNSGTTPLVLSGISINGNFAFAPGTTCANGESLAPTASCSIAVTFTPTSTGQRSGNVIISDNAQHSPSEIGLSGTGD